VLESAPNPDGTISWWLSNKFSFRDASGRRYVGGIALDITDRKLAEEALRVEDNGVGIPSDEQSHVFDLFSQVRVHQGKSAQGLGIGLAIVRTLVELHGGTVEAASAGLGRGSAFTVRLPVPKEPVAKSALQDLSLDEFQGAQQRRRVLIVDDNEDAAQVLAEFLRLDGHQTWIANDGFKAIEISRTTKLDLVLMDLGMPDLDGIETTKRIHAIPGCERLRVAALTGWNQESDRALTREAGFDWHFAKPINPAFLTEFVAKLEPLNEPSPTH
jgi:CheY-like chemotaxis protein